jgi:Flp pilus assembly protein TadG
MTRLQQDRPTAPRRARGDAGTALVEFSLVAVLLFLVIYGIISFGLLLSFKQDLTRAAAEGARAGAVAVPVDDAVGDAVAATNEAVEGFGKSCGEGGMTCTVSPATFDCDGSGPGDAKCVEVTLQYDNEADPVTPPFPLLSAFMPDTLEATSVARVNS